MSDLIDLSKLASKQNNDDESTGDKKAAKEDSHELKKIKKRAENKLEKSNDKINEVDDAVVKRNLVQVLNLYIQFFPEKLKEFRHVNFEKKTIRELADIRRECDFIMGSRNTINATTKLAIEAIKMLEFALNNYTPLNVTGFADEMLDEESLDDIKLLCLSNMVIFESKPEHRLMFKAFTTALRLHGLNTMAATPLQRVVITEPEENYHNERTDPGEHYDNVPDDSVKKINDKFDDL